MLKEALQVEVRTEKGTGVSRRLRREEKVPAIIYGGHVKPLMITVNAKKMDAVLHSGEKMMRIVTSDSAVEDKTVLLKDVQFDPITQKILHVDFDEVAMDEEIHIKVPLELKGPAMAEKLGGVVNQSMYDVLVACLPANLPEKIVVDITAMNIGDTIHLSEVKGVDNVRFLTPVDSTVVTVTHQRKEEEMAPPVEGEEGAAKEPEVIAKERKVEESEES